MHNTTSFESEKVMNVAKAFLARRGYEEIKAFELSSRVDLIAKDDKTTVLLAVNASCDRFDDCDMTRGEYEEILCEAAALGVIEVDSTLRFDVLSIRVIGEERAIIRHHINKMS